MDTRTAGKARELEVLKAIGLNGWLTTRLAGAWVWNDSNAHASTNRAQIVLARLLKKKEVAKRETMAGPTAWILTKSGADRVNVNLIAEGYERGWAHHGYDAGTLNFVRHESLVDYLAAKLKEPGVLGAIGKAGLRAGIAPGLEEADGAYIKSNFDGGYTVVGVLSVTNAREGIQTKLKSLRTQKQVIDLAGDARIVATLRKRTSV